MNYKIIILAAGKGTRMDSDLPKVLMPLGDSTLIQHLLGNLDLKNKPTVVVGYQQDLVRDLLGNMVNYAVQSEQLGTGHAVIQAKGSIPAQADTIVVLYGDQPFVNQKTVDSLVEQHQQSEATITMGVIDLPDFDNWRSSFWKYGRIVRDSESHVCEIIEYKDATDEERAIKTVNPAYFVFDKHWLFAHLNILQNNNAQQEYYLTDLIKIAFEEEQKIKAVEIDPKTGLGANTKEQLAVLESFLNDS